MKSRLVGLFAVLVVGGLLALGWVAYKDFLTQGQRPPKELRMLDELEDSVPNFTLKNIEGEPVSLEDFKDKVIIVNFWASWCDPCVEEFPSLIKLIEHFKGEVVLLAISADYTMEDLTGFLEVFEAKSPHIQVMWDKERRVAKQFGTKVLPESYIISQGKLIKKIAGVDNWYAPDAIKYFEILIANPGQKPQ